MSSRWLLCLLVGLCGASYGKDVHWQSSPSQAMARAAKANKLVMLFFFAPWDNWSGMLDHQVFSNPKVVQALAPMECVRINGDSPEGKKIRDKYRVNTYPLTLFLDGAGEVILRRSGFVPPEDFIDRLNIAERVHRDLVTVRRKISKNPNDPLSIELMAVLYAKRYMPSEAKKYVARAEKVDPKNKAGSLAVAYNSMGDYYQLNSNYRDAVAYFGKGRLVGHNTEEKYYSLISLISCYRATNRLGAMRPLFGEILDLPNLPESYRQTAMNLSRVLNRGSGSAHFAAAGD